MKLIGRRLPDLMIGILIVVLALGLGSLLLTQRNRTAAVPALPPAASEPTTAIPAAPGTVDIGTVNTPPATTAITPPAAAQPSTVPNPSSTGPTPTGPTATGGVAAPTTPQPDTSAPPVSTTPQPSATTPGTTTPAAPPRSGGAVATSANRTPLRRDYRISLGTFGSVAEANASTAAVRALGYNVYPIDLGSQVVAQVGPFADSAAANAALSDISRAYGSAVVYAPRQSATGGAVTPAPAATAPTPTAPATPAPSTTAPILTPPASSAPVSSAPTNSATPGFSAADSSSAGTSTAPATSAAVTPPEAPSTPPTTPGSDAPAPEPVTAAPAAPAPATSPAAASPAPTSPPTGKVSAPAPSGPVYLQVGAFDRQDSAQKMVGLLSDLGYNPSVQAPEGRKVTVLIGPFSGDAVLRAETKLNDNGFDHFRVR